MTKYDFCFDIDGVLTKDIEGHDYKNRVPNVSFINAIKVIISRGNSICFYTARYPEDEQITRDWFEEQGLPKDLPIFFGKPLAEVYVDDRAFNYSAPK